MQLYSKKLSEYRIDFTKIRVQTVLSSYDGMVVVTTTIRLRHNHPTTVHYDSRPTCVLWAAILRPK